jgi:hypothetical protein
MRSNNQNLFMKTSNKILLGFFMLIFAAPVLLFMGFRSKITKGEFTVTRTDANGQFTRKGAIKPYKVVKVVGPFMPEVFSCYIIPAGAASYAYTNYGYDDSINLQQKGDTLLVTYNHMNLSTDNNSDSYTNLSINLYLPEINNIIIQGAGVFIDSMNAKTDTAVYFSLTKWAKLTLGKFGSSTTVSAAVTENPGNSVPDSIINRLLSTEKSTGRFNKLNIIATDSYVDFGMHAWMKDLNLNLHGSSTVELNGNSRIEQLTGFISDSASVKANWKNIRRLATLTGK